MAYIFLNWKKILGKSGANKHLKFWESIPYIIQYSFKGFSIDGKDVRALLSFKLKDKNIV